MLVCRTLAILTLSRFVPVMYYYTMLVILLALHAWRALHATLDSIFYIDNTSAKLAEMMEL